MKVSSELMSQTMSKYVLSSLLYQMDRTKWTKNFNQHDLTIEAWATGVWVKQAGLVSYADLAKVLKLEADTKAYQLSVEKVPGGFLVSSFQGGARKYSVSIKNKKWTCDCMRYRCWFNRMQEELPQLYKALNHKIFCHHIVAAYEHQKFLKQNS
ncbi:hypothetical protein Cylst_5244 [Cylindrospermum stagnale PCC 7417]|uniref:SWIM-type domain-containing protein n=1 Tax=Cylindrospermum stagnale PCC 7417 TaxID=56107 RepID=K9X6K9_9NOST|nr:hypothetical protein [Cylindrospermum stagnale]AFZ27277.1 hypothetical protein Cylst_5244 [Cylindrospermum stagnale PCC 7417]